MPNSTLTFSTIRTPSSYPASQKRYLHGGRVDLRVPCREIKLKPATAQPSGADAARFAVALTVCVMRYISDVHIGSTVLEQLRAGKLFIRQPPSPKNSLRLLKFIFPNNYNVYMHDTPEQVLFSKSRRDFSHGCIRLEKPADLAVWVLRENPGWNMERVRATMNESTTQQVNLAQPIAVFIVYGTVIVTEDGITHFYHDIYGHDAELERFWPRGIRLRVNRLQAGRAVETPLAHAAGVDVDNVAVRIVAHATANQA